VRDKEDALAAPSDERGGVLRGSQQQQVPLHTSLFRSGAASPSAGSVDSNRDAVYTPDEAIIAAAVEAGRRKQQQQQQQQGRRPGDVVDTVRTVPAPPRLSGAPQVAPTAGLFELPDTSDDDE